ncbi:hypothetical protein [Pseudobacteriovorax antillogorgiicola]|nr:hypothetical protein [Pseudobacteriovorax antillogorgiicola]
MIKITPQTDDLSDIKEDITKDTVSALSREAADAACCKEETL